MKKLIYALAVTFLLVTVSFSTLFASNNKKQQHWGVPYSITYLAKNHKLAEVNDAYTRVYFNVYLPQGTNFIYWEVTFDDGSNTYSFVTNPYVYYTLPYYEDSWSGIPQGTYTVTVHNQSYSNGYLFDAVLNYTDANNQQQSPYFWDKNTDNSDFVFPNVYIPGNVNTSIGFSLSAHH